MLKILFGLENRDEHFIGLTRVLDLQGLIEKSVFYLFFYIGRYLGEVTCNH
jgi:hypothetical protein